MAFLAIRSVKEFENFIKYPKNTKDIIIDIKSSLELRKLVECYNHIENRVKELLFSDSVIVNIYIEQMEDYKEKFGDIFCYKENNINNIRKEFLNWIFRFVKRDKHDLERIFNGYIKLSDKKIYSDIAEKISLILELTIFNIDELKSVTELIYKNAKQKTIVNVALKVNLVVQETEDFLMLVELNNLQLKTKEYYVSFEYSLNFRNSSYDLICDSSKLEDMSNYYSYYLNSLKTQKPFVLKFIDKTKNINFAILNSVILLCYKIKKSTEDKPVFLDISVTQDNYFRLIAYLNIAINDGIFVICNNKILINNLEYIGKLPPLAFIDKEGLNLFQSPISREFWDIITKGAKEEDLITIKPDSFEDCIDNKKGRKFWAYFRLCQKYLFEDFEDNQSAAYTKLRRIAYANDEFYNNYISQIPFLAVCIFAMYDNYYRNNLLLKFKTETKINKIGINDLILSKQDLQSWENYKLYKQIKNKYDIKNLLLDIDDYKLHSTVVSTLFESISIAEGILQLLENAVIHANGGVFSMRIFDRAKGIISDNVRKPEHIEYLNSTYKEEYFDYIDTPFFLEVYISDLNNQSVPESFLKKNSYLDKVDLKFFFKPDDGQIEERNKFYRMNNENYILHYGLEIFNNILTARKGLLFVSGFGLYYDNLDDVFKNGVFKMSVFKYIEENKNQIAKMLGIDIKDNDLLKDQYLNMIREKVPNKSLSGTCYKILLPLNHFYSNRSNTVDDEIIIKEDINKLNNEAFLYIISKEKLLTKLNSDKDKIENIRAVKKEIEDCVRNKNTGIEDDKASFCINFYSNIKDYNSNKYFETIIKGILLYAIDRKMAIVGNDIIIPIALINLTDFELLEATRIIAIYYSKNYANEAKSDFENLKNIAIYLRCYESGKEIIFDGNNLDEVKEKVLKMALSNGAMYSEITTIVEILNKIQKV